MSKFKELQTTWYAKLKAEGFIDYELKRDQITRERRTAKSKDEVAIKAYFAIAQDHLHTWPFESELDRRIWELHADALSSRKIGEKVGKSHFYVLKRIKIQKAFANL